MKLYYRKTQNIPTQPAPPKSPEIPETFDDDDNLTHLTALFPHLERHQVDTILTDCNENPDEAAAYILGKIFFYFPKFQFSADLQMFLILFFVWR